MKRKPIGQILLEHTPLTETQLEEVLLLQKTSSKKLGEILIEKNYLNVEHILTALSVQLGISFQKEINGDEIDPTLIMNLPITFAKRHEILPIEKKGNIVRVATTDPLNVEALDEIRVILGAQIETVISTPHKIQDAINRVYEKKSQREISDLDQALELEDLSYELDQPVDLLDVDDEAPIIRLVNSLLFRAVKEGATDIHIEPYERDISVRFRVDGILHEVYKPPKRFQGSIASRIKIMGNLNIAEKRLPQDGRIGIKVGGKDIDVRLSVIPTSHGERIVMRLLDKTTTLITLENLGFSGQNLRHINEVIHQNHGIFLVTGPTGSGKSTTLYAGISKINTVDRNIITIEDPVEYQMKGVGQIQVNPKINLTFANGLRSILRQDPNIIMIGEIRDLETAEIAIQASLTGHLVLATIHTNDAPSTVTRLIDMGVEPFLVSSSLLAILAQRLIRKLCETCKQPHTALDEELDQIGITQTQAAEHTIYKAQGCSDCLNKGYKGRTAIHELMIMSDAVKDLVLKNMDAGTIKKQAVNEGMITLRDSGIEKILEGSTSIAEILRATQVEIL
ncbi:MAG: type II secretion system ATPase GspE [Deltaproteobacteria bacterium]|nr:type II secretion system ATPase GspE [Deltaproteobacteria bacterium]